MARAWGYTALVVLVGAGIGAYAAAQSTSGQRETKYPASCQPDEVTLTWAGDPATSISVQWRTDATVTTGSVAYAPAEQGTGFPGDQARVAAASAGVIEDAGLAAQPRVIRHTARLRRLQPGTRYLYAIRNSSYDAWGPTHSFRTAPAPDSTRAPFSFVYLGDAQYGFAKWAKLQQAAFRARPEAAFFMMAGDLVTRGNERDDWDDLLSHAEAVFARCPVVPTIGNHEYKGETAPRMYRQQFDLPRNGPRGMPEEHAYSLVYGNLLVVVLDANLPPREAAPWLEEQLARSRETWKVALFHEPLYSSDPDRDNQELRETWGPIFDRHHVDVVFQGHDHAYLRTHPMRAGKPVASPAEGTIYLVSVSGSKMYEQGSFGYTAAGFTNTATYSLVDIIPATGTAGDRLEYRAYDAEGTLRDEFSIEKGK